MRSADFVAELAALTLFIAALLLWASIIETCHRAGLGLLACVGG